MSTKDKIGWFLIAFGVYSFFQGGSVLPSIVSTPVSAVTYVYEKDDNAIPNGVQAALNKLNRERQIVATPYEDDNEDGTGEVPEQYKLAYEAAKQAGLPALVVVAGDKVVRLVKAPKTDAEVLEAVP